MEAPPSEYRTPNAEFDYDQIKQLARQERRRVTDYLALARHHDPFYAGCGFRKRNAEWFADLWGRLGFGHGVHLRRIHYVLVSGTEDGSPIAKPNGDPYRNTDNDWDLLGDASLNARYLELIPPDALVDRRNDEPMIFAPEAPDGTARIDLENRWPSVGYIEDPPELPSLDLSGLEPERDRVVEVWIEKSTQNDWLVPLCRRRGVNLVVGVGEMSEVLTCRLVDRVRETGKPTHVIYISDFDPAGRSMPVAAARKVEFHLRRPGAAGHVTLNPLILTEEQCRRYRLPRVPIKESEARRGGFEQMFGAGATELDALEALHPGEMAKLVGGEIDRHIDPTFERRFASSRLELEL